jgi:hypothetical protein
LLIPDSTIKPGQHDDPPIFHRWRLPSDRFDDLVVGNSGNGVLALFEAR